MSDDETKVNKLVTDVGLQKIHDSPRNSFFQREER